MPLPASRQPWPPKEHSLAYAKIDEWAAWYSGEPDRLQEAAPQTPRWRFWSRTSRANADGTQRANIHVPVASDLAAVSAALLFGEAPRVRIKAAHENDPEPEEAEEPELDEAGLPVEPKEPEKPKKKPETTEQKVEARLLEMIEMGDVVTRLLEAAESAAAVGGVYIYPAWDKEVRDFPIFAIAQADMAIPEFRWGFLTSVTFHRIVRSEGNVVWRHLERHEVEGTGEQRQAVVLNGLYRGGPADLGERVGLGDSEATVRLLPRVQLPFSELDVEYVPNIRPNRLWRSSGLGVADIQGSETLLDAIDETYASWMRDIRLAKARIIVPREYLIADDDAVIGFDIDQEVYTPMQMEPTTDRDTRMMMAHQFEIRYEAHRETAREFMERVVSNAGYVPATLGQSSEAIGNRTGTALRISEHKTILTQRRKSAWWKVAVANVLYHMQQIDREEFGQSLPAIRPTVEMSDSIIDQPLELAQTALAMKTAEAASTETRVRIIHPSWTDAEIAAEVEKIEGEIEAAKPPLPPQFGNPDTDEASTQNLPRQNDRGRPPANKPPTSPPFARRA